MSDKFFLRDTVASIAIGATKLCYNSEHMQRYMNGLRSR